jgi:hypothetical protein
MVKQPFYGELLIEDCSSGTMGFPKRKMLYVLIWENNDGELLMELHNNLPDPNTLIGHYGEHWLLKKVKWSLFVTVFELTILKETPPVKARCVTGHKFGKMLENAILKQKLERKL